MAWISSQKTNDHGFNMRGGLDWEETSEERELRELKLDFGDALNVLRQLDPNWEVWYDAQPDEHINTFLPKLQARVKMLQGTTVEHVTHLRVKDGKWEVYEKKQAKPVYEFGIIFASFLAYMRWQHPTRTFNHEIGMRVQSNPGRIMAAGELSGMWFD
jgi:hypothetical protein